MISNAIIYIFPDFFYIRDKREVIIGKGPKALSYQKVFVVGAVAFFDVFVFSFLTFHKVKHKNKKILQTLASQLIFITLFHRPFHRNRHHRRL